MTIAYYIKPDDSADRYNVDGAHAFMCPSLECPVCGLWISVATDYPSISAESQPRALHVAEAKNSVGVDEWNSLKASVRAKFGEDVLIEPCSCFGPLEVTITGKLPQVAWLSAWMILMNNETLGAFKRKGVELTPVRATIRKPASHVPLFEIEARRGPRLKLLKGTKPPCVVCGRTGIKGPAGKSFALVAETYGPNVPIQRIYELPTYLIVNERFRDAYEELGLTGATIKEVTLAT
jgi:hypothetical protein